MGRETPMIFSRISFRAEVAACPLFLRRLFLGRVDIFLAISNAEIDERGQPKRFSSRK